MSLESQIESLLFISIKPLSVKFFVEQLKGQKKEDIVAALEVLMVKHNREGSGITLQKIEDKYQMVTAGENAALIGEFLKDETTGELTPASLETLTVIGYRGPISKTELEIIRGVNCSLILRNLLIRGLIEEKKDANELLSTYQISFDFLRHLGLSSASELPEYISLNSDENLQKLLHPAEVQSEGAQTLENTGELTA